MVIMSARRKRPWFGDSDICKDAWYVNNVLVPWGNRLNLKKTLLPKPVPTWSRDNKFGNLMPKVFCICAGTTLNIQRMRCNT